ncbi:MAG TPA: hypothetical protein PLF13_09755 [candidate division Zixibacteria bacterium]|nr:hypothetical protein [candidate division Zixibacteria bacterium]
MSDKRVLLICYYFPPLGGAGIGRPLAMYRNLERFGWEGHVLTVKDVLYRVYEPSLLEKLDKDYIYRSDSFDPQRQLWRLGKRRMGATLDHGAASSANLFFPDNKRGWVRYAVKMGRALHEQNQYRAIISSSPPISGHLVGQQLHRELNLPWIADFRDFWTSYTIEQTYQPERLKRKAHHLLKSVREQARLTVCNPSIAAYLGDGKVIYNSYDEEDAALWTEPPHDSMFRIALLGTFNELTPVNPLFQVIRTVLDHNPDLVDQIELIQVGNVNRAELEKIISRKLPEVRTAFHGFQERGDTIRLLNSCHLMYIGLNDDTGREIIPGRLFTMFASGRPVLAAVDEGSASGRLIGETGNGLCFSDQTAGTAAEYLESLISRWNHHDLDIIPGPGYSQKFSSVELAQQFAGVLDEIVG